LNIPCSHELGDMPAMLAHHMSPAAYADMLIDAFEEMRRLVKLHPQHLVYSLPLRKSVSGSCPSLSPTQYMYLSSCCCFPSFFSLLCFPFSLRFIGCPFPRRFSVLCLLQCLLLCSFPCLSTSLLVVHPATLTYIGLCVCDTPHRFVHGGAAREDAAHSSCIRAHYGRRERAGLRHLDHGA
jgi:hypothetical protein